MGHLARGPVCMAMHVAALGASQRQFCSKRPEHCDLELFGSGKADVMGSAVGECAFCFLPREHQTESCGKYFAQTHRVPSLELANLQLLHELCTPWTSPFPSHLSPPAWEGPAHTCPWRIRASGAPSPAFSCQERKSRELSSFSWSPGLGWARL